jgi:hypothetical protein
VTTLVDHQNPKQDLKIKHNTITCIMVNRVEENIKIKKNQTEFYNVGFLKIKKNIK